MQREVNLISIDLAKTIFWVRAEDEFGNCLFSKKVRRERLFEVVVQLKPRRIAFEACGSAHYWGRRFESAGLRVMMIPPQFVKPFRRGDKNDANDAWAICEAARRPDLKTVRVKSTEHQDLQMMLRTRESLVGRRTQVANEMRSFLLEYGFAVPLGTAKLLLATRNLLAIEREQVTAKLAAYLERTLEGFRQLDEQIKFYDKALSTISKNDCICKELTKLAGVGAITAVAIRAAVVNPLDYKNGRQLAAFWGLVPRQNSSGGKTRLLGIGKDGNRYIRQLLIHGGRSVVRVADRHSDPVSLWAAKKFKERGFNKACVAVANKNARMVWAIMAKNARMNQAA